MLMKETDRYNELQRGYKPYDAIVTAVESVDSGLTSPHSGRTGLLFRQSHQYALRLSPHYLPYHCRTIVSCSV
jgi:hypothetical protein